MIAIIRTEIPFIVAFDTGFPERLRFSNQVTPRIDEQIAPPEP